MSHVTAESEREGLETETLKQKALLIVGSYSTKIISQQT